MNKTLITKRLVLRRFTLKDAPVVQELASEYEIASTTLRIPHPYELGDAEDWIIKQSTAIEEEKELTWAITLPEDGQVVGSVGLILVKEFKQAELGYWIGKPFWGKGYASEAARAVLEFSFNELKLKRVHAHHMSRNPASGKVLSKIGMQHEGHLRSHIRKWGQFEDIDIYGILQSEFHK